MKLINKAMALIMVIILSFSLCACSGSTDTGSSSLSPIETEQNTEAIQTENTNDEIDFDNLVTDAVYETLADPFSSQVCYYHIPKINLPNSLADTINETMLNDAEEFMEDARKSIDGGYSITHAGYNYVWGHNDSVVSVVTGCFFNTPGLEYTTYNLSLDTGETLSNDDLGQLYGFSQQELTDLIIDKAGKRFEENYKEAKEGAGDFYYSQYNRTITEENANNSQLYINENGDLCCVATIYSLAGAESYKHLINLTGNTTPSDIDVMS